MKHFDWEIKGAPIRLELGPRDIDSGNCVITERTGKKYDVKLETLEDTVSAALNSVADELRSRANNVFSSLVLELPDIISSGSDYQFSSPLSDGTVYSFPFCGNDSDAEALEKLSGLTMLGECVENYPEPRKCIITGIPTTNKHHLARMY